MPDSSTVTDSMTALLKNLQTNFDDRFDDFKIPTSVMMFVRDPFKTHPSSDFSSESKTLLPSVDEGSLQLELVDIQSSSALRDDFKEMGATQFWSQGISQELFPNARKIALFILTMFGSTYTCESSFSHMNAIKTQNRSSLCNARLQDCLRIALTSHQPNFLKLSQLRKCHFSH